MLDDILADLNQTFLAQVKRALSKYGRAVTTETSVSVIVTSGYVTDGGIGDAGPNIDTTTVNWQPTEAEFQINSIIAKL